MEISQWWNAGFEARSRRPPIVSVGFLFQFLLKTKPSFTLRWNIDIDPLTALHFKAGEEISSLSKLA